MTKFVYKEDPIVVCRDGGYPLAELLTPENRRKMRERVKEPDYVNSKVRFKELFSKRGVIVNPEAMSFLYQKD